MWALILSYLKKARREESSIYKLNENIEVSHKLHSKRNISYHLMYMKNYWIKKTKTVP